MPITINLDGVEAWKGGATLPPGRHLCRCVDAEEGKSSGGHFELHLTWESTSGEFQGGQLQDWVQVTEASLGKVRQLMDATQVQVPSGQFALSAQMFLGSSAEVIARAGTKPNGEPKTEVAAYNRPAKGSDLGTNQAQGFAHQPAAVGAQDDPPPF